MKHHHNHHHHHHQLYQPVEDNTFLNTEEEINLEE